MVTGSRGYQVPGGPAEPGYVTATATTVLPAQQALADLLDAVTAVRMGNFHRAAQLSGGDAHSKAQLLRSAVTLLASIIDEAYKGGDVIAYLEDVVQPLIYV
jgi:hypothetical protein